MQDKRGGACLVKCDVVCRPKEHGGLGIHNLKCFQEGPPVKIVLVLPMTPSHGKE
jgi:hypothetical protein